MASSTPSAHAMEVGLAFILKYYNEVGKQTPDLVHAFYQEPSAMSLVKSNSTQTASNLPAIHTLIKSLSFTDICIETIDCQDSYEGGILVKTLGLIEIKGVSGRRKFIRTFFLAPKEDGNYFVRNDIFYFAADGEVHPNRDSLVEDHSDSAKGQEDASPSYSLPEQDQTSQYSAHTVRTPSDVPQTSTARASPPSDVNRTAPSSSQLPSSESTCEKPPFVSDLEKEYGVNLESDDEW